MKSVFYCLSQPAGHAANEIIDAISVSAVFDQPTALAFMDQGVLQLLDESHEGQGKNTSKLIAALPTFDLDEFLVEREALDQLFPHIDEPILIQRLKSVLPTVVVKSSAAINRRMHEFDMVVTD